MVLIAYGYIERYFRMQGFFSDLSAIFATYWLTEQPFHFVLRLTIDAAELSIIYHLLPRSLLSTISHIFLDAQTQREWILCHAERNIDSTLRCFSSKFNNYLQYRNRPFNLWTLQISLGWFWKKDALYFCCNWNFIFTISIAV